MVCIRWVYDSHRICLLKHTYDFFNYRYTFWNPDYEIGCGIHVAVWHRHYELRLAFRVSGLYHECHMVVCRRICHCFDPSWLGVTVLHHDNRYPLWTSALQIDEAGIISFRKDHQLVPSSNEHKDHDEPEFVQMLMYAIFPFSSDCNKIW